MSSVQPPAPYVPPTPAQPAPVEGEAVPAEIVKLPPTLADNDRALTLRGEVLAAQPDGTVRIATPRGPVEVKLPEPVPQRGQTVEIQIPAGSPPRSAAVTIPPQQAQQPVPLPTQPAPAQPPVQNAPVPPAPNTPPPVTGNTPQPQTPVPAQPAQMPRDEISVRPQNPNAPAPVPGQPQPQNANPQLSPQGLLNFLKTSLDTLMKSPVANSAAPNAQVPGAPLQQRPLQVGQMLRLTALPVGQPITSPVAPAASAGMPALSPAIQGMQSPMPQTIILLPQGANTLPMPLLQNIQQAVQAPAAAMLTPQGAALPVQVDPLARLLMPTLSAAASPQIAGPAPATTPVLNQMPVLNQGPLPTMIPPAAEGAPLQNHQPIITARPGMQIPALTQPMDVRVTAMLPTAPAMTVQNPAIATLLHGSPATPVMFAQITGQTPQGLPVVELPTFTTLADGTTKPATTMMVLQFPARAMPPSTILQLNILPLPQGAQTMTSSFAGLPALGDTMAWDALDDVLRSTGHTPGGPAAALQAAMPKPGAAAFTAPVMMMAAALRSGDLSAWIGEKGLEAIKTSRRADALARIGNDFAAAGKRMDEPAQPGEWKSMSMPMFYGQEVSRIQLYYRSFTGGEGEGNQAGKKNGTRFVMDLSLNRMGPMQIDGFSIGAKLDITLRSEKPLSPGMREAMRTRYHEAVSGIGFAGELNFSAGPDHKGWVVMDESARLGASA